MYEKARKFISVAMFFLGTVFVVYGVHRKEVETVFSKAVKICLECVGIG